MTDTMHNLLFLEARTHYNWLDVPVKDSLLHQAYELARMGPTSANCCPMRIVFVKSAEGREKLMPCIDEGNVKKTLNAPVTAIIGHDLEFYNQLPKLFPHADARSWFLGNESLIKETAFRNSSLQGAYFILAARSVGLDCGPMSGFNKEAVDEAFFADTTIRSNFLCNLGYGDPEQLYPRCPRLTFDEACKVV